MKKALKFSVYFSFLSALSCLNIESSMANKNDEQDLYHLLKQDCGSCHGMTLRGGLGPELSPSTMQKMGGRSVFDTIKYGRPTTAMPPWQAILSDHQIEEIVEMLMDGKAYE